MKPYRKTPEGLFICEECQKTLKNEKCINSHVYKHMSFNDYKVKWLLDDEEKKFVCKKCELVFISKQKLSFHINYNHDVKEYYDNWIKKDDEGICTVCGQEALFRHIRDGYQFCCSEKCKYINIKHIKCETKNEKSKDPNYQKNINNKRKNTKKEKYGDENFVNPKKASSTFKKHLNEDKDFQSKINEKHRETCEELYGDPCYRNKEQSSKTKKEKKKDPNYMKEIILKQEKTCMEKYNVKYVMQDPKIFEKNQKSKLKLKYYKDTNILYQGSYEFDFLKKYYEAFKDEIQRGPKIEYLDFSGNQFKIYHPHYFLPSLNLIIGIKNSYLFEKDKIQIKSKENACKKLGFNYIIIIDKKYINFEKLLKNKN